MTPAVTNAFAASALGKFKFANACGKPRGMTKRAHHAGLSLLFTLLLSALGWIASPVAAAAPSDEQRAAARSMAEQGSRAYGEKRFADAVDLFQRAEALIHSPVHLLFIARASVELGQLVKAQETYIKISRETLPSDAPPAFHKAVEQANEELQALKPRIAYATVTVSGVDPQTPLQLLVDKQPVANVLIGVPMPLDPGTHNFEATAPGFISASSELTMSEGQSGQVELVLAADPNATTQSSAAPEPAVGTVANPAADAGSDNAALRYAAYGALAVGAVGVGVGTYFLVDSMGHSSNADDLFNECNSSSAGCSTRQRRDIRAEDDEAAKVRSRAVVGYVVGGVGIAAGVVLLVLSSDDDAADVATGPSVRPWVGWSSVGVTGTF